MELCFLKENLQKRISFSVMSNILLVEKPPFKIFWACFLTGATGKLKINVKLPLPEKSWETFRKSLFAWIGNCHIKNLLIKHEALFCPSSSEQIENFVAESIFQIDSLMGRFKLQINWLFIRIILSKYLSLKSTVARKSITTSFSLWKFSFYKKLIFFR